MRVAVGLGGAGLGFALFGPAGAKWGYAIGSLLGSILFPAPAAKTPAPKPGQLSVPTSQYGLVVPVLYGTRKKAGNLIWHGEMQVTELKQKVGGGGGLGKGFGGSKKQTVGFEYRISMAFVLCMSLSPRKTVIKAWQNKEEMSLDKFTIYDGSQTAGHPQMTSLIEREAVMKNICYAYFEDFLLPGGGTSIPHFQFEVSDVPACPSVSATSFVSSNGGYEDGDLIYENGYLYKATGDNPAKIEKVDTADMSLDSTLVLGEIVRIGAALQKLGRVGEKKLWAMTRWIGAFGRHTKMYCIDIDTFVIEKERFLSSTVLGTDGKTYVCWVAHVSSGINRPITGAQYGLKWEEVTGGITHDDLEGWVTGKQYFRCAATGTSAFTYSPRTDKMYWVSSEGGNNSIVFEFDPFLITTLRSAVIVDIININEAKADNNYIYIAEGATAVADVVQFNPANMVENARFTASPSTTQVWIELIDGFLYVLNSGGTKLYKVDTADMTELTSIVPPIMGNPQDIVASWGGVLLTDGLSVHRFNLDDLSLVCTTIYETVGSGNTYAVYDEAGSYGDLFISRDESVGDPSNEIYKIESAAGNDVLPPDVTEDVFNNDLYGLGLASGYWNMGDNNDTRAYCETEDFKVSMLFESQMSVLDVFAYVIQHHNGYIRYSNGKISHMQLQASDPIVATITDTELVKEKNKLPVQVRKAGHRDTKNKINVEYVKRNRDYIAGIASVDSITDVDAWGLRPATVLLDGYATFERASKIADILLRKSLLNPRGISFKLGPKSLGFLVGEVITLQDTGVEINDAIRIGSISEGANNVLEIAGSERIPEVYEFRVTGEDTSVLPEPSDLRGDVASVIHPMAVELPALYSGSTTIIAITYERPNVQAWAGTSLYRAYTSGGSYDWVESVPQSGVTGMVVEVGTDANDQEYIDVLLDYDETLSSALDFDDLITTPMLNLFVVETSGGTSAGDIFCRFTTAVLQTGRVWRLTGLIYDTVDFAVKNSYGIIDVFDRFAMADQVPYFYATVETEKFRTLSYKLASFNHVGEEQTLADAVIFSEVVDALGSKPLTPINVKVNGLGIDSTDSLKVSDSGIDMNLEWRSRNRFNTGGYNYDRIDGVNDDLDFLSFEMEAYKSNVLLWTETLTDKTFNYTAAQQATDVAVNTTIDFRLRQHGDSHSSDWKEFALVFV